MLLIPLTLSLSKGRPPLVRQANQERTRGLYFNCWLDKVLAGFPGATAAAFLHPRPLLKE